MKIFVRFAVLGHEFGTSLTIKAPQLANEIDEVEPVDAGSS